MTRQMPATSTKTSTPLRVRLRLFHGDEAALGPGRVELLGRIAEGGSVQQAAREMELSYMKAWKLIQSMNRCFRAPLVELRRGGKDGGSALLTDTGRAVLTIYRDMEHRAREASEPGAAELARLLAP